MEEVFLHKQLNVVLSESLMSIESFDEERAPRCLTMVLSQKPNP